jgi:hypothetical protein
MCNENLITKDVIKIVKKNVMKISKLDIYPSKPNTNSNCLQITFQARIMPDRRWFILT